MEKLCARLFSIYYLKFIIIILQEDLSAGNTVRIQALFNILLGILVAFIII